MLVERGSEKERERKGGRKEERGLKSRILYLFDTRKRKGTRRGRKDIGGGIKLSTLQGNIKALRRLHLVQLTWNIEQVALSNEIGDVRHSHTTFYHHVSPFKIINFLISFFSYVLRSKLIIWLKFIKIGFF